MGVKINHVGIKSIVANCRSVAADTLTVDADDALRDPKMLCFTARENYAGQRINIMLSVDDARQFAEAVLALVAQVEKDPT